MTPIRLTIAIIALLALAASARLYDLQSDPPAVFAEGSQDLTTDGGYLTMHARSAILFHSWDPLGDSSWRPFKLSLVSAVAYGCFAVAGVSLATANLVGALLNLGALLLFLFALSRYYTRRGLVITAYFLCTSFLLTDYGRVPLAENSILFFAAVIFCVYTFWFERVWGQVVVGVLCSLCGLFGKGFGFFIVAGPLAFVIVNSPRQYNRYGILLGSLLITVVGLSLSLYGVHDFWTFLLARGVGEHGFPHGLSSPRGFFENLISVAQTGLHRYAPIISVVTAVALAQLLAGTKRQWANAKLLCFMIGWLGIWLLVLSPFNYHPLRYMFMLVIPLAAIAGLFLDSLPEIHFGWNTRVTWWQLALLGLLGWYVAYNCIASFMSTKEMVVYYRMVWLALPVGLLLAGAYLVVTRRVRRPISRGTAAAFLVAALCLTTALDARFYVLWFRSRATTISQASQDIGQLLAPGAVLSGQYGPALCSDNRLPSLLYMLTDDLRVAKRELDQYPVTHIAVAKPYWDRMLASHPQLSTVPIVAFYWLRDNTIYVLRTTAMFGNAQARLYQPSDFERAAAYLQFGPKDSSRTYLDRFAAAYPTNKTAMWRQYYLRKEREELSDLRPLIDSLLERYDTDFWVDYTAATYYKLLAQKTGNPDLRQRSEDLLERAIRYNSQSGGLLRKQYGASDDPKSKE